MHSTKSPRLSENESLLVREKYKRGEKTVTVTQKSNSTTCRILSTTLICYSAKHIVHSFIGKRHVTPDPISFIKITHRQTGKSELTHSIFFFSLRKPKKRAQVYIKEILHMAHFIFFFFPFVQFYISVPRPSRTCLEVFLLISF